MPEVTAWSAARSDDDRLLRALLRENPGICNARDADGHTPLHIAALNGSIAALRELIEAGADPNVRSNSGRTPLLLAAFAGEPDAYLQLRDAGADTATTDLSGTTLLHAAAAGGSMEILSEVLSAGSDAGASNLFGELPIHRAAQGDHLEIVKQLFEVGTSRDPLDSYHMTLLHKAANRGAVQTATWLLDQGLNPLSGDLAGGTPLHSAASFGRVAMAQLLLDRGVDVNIRNHQQATPLYAAASAGHRPLVTLLLERGADPAALDNYGQGPLHVAAVRGHADVIQELLAAGAPAGIADIHAHRPFELAALYGRDKAWKELSPPPAALADPQFTPQAAHALGQQPVASGEVRVWYLGHSGWAVRTAHHLFILDYAPDATQNGSDSLAHGRINPSLWGDTHVFVLVTHDHADHFDRRVLEWEHPLLRTVFGWDAPEALHGFRLEGQEIKEIGEVVIASIPSTDSGSAFLVEADGVSFYHAGDHAAETVPVETAFTDGIDWLAAQFAPIQAAFLPVFGCGLPRPEALRAGNAYTLDRLAPSAAFPMHIGWTSHFYHQFARWVRSNRIPVEVGIAQHPGDRFLLRRGVLQRLWR
jgi:ankyrin repeat protein/L-ascorbate metabolism protein UlaG (beta-lactamase superfamily)